jgi:putative nucleic acid modification protein with dual OB domain
MPFANLQSLVDTPNTLWSNGDSTYNGLNDRVRVESASKLSISLVLIQPEALTIGVKTEGQEFGNPRRRVRAHFAHRGVRYILVVTDPVAERAFLAKPNGDYPLRGAYLCLSLGEPHTDGCCYKLVAAVITSQPL